MGTQSLSFLLHIILNKYFTMLTRYEWTPVRQIQRLFTKGALQKKKEVERRTRKERAEVPTPSPFFPFTVHSLVHVIINNEVKSYPWPYADIFIFILHDIKPPQTFIYPWRWIFLSYRYFYMCVTQLTSGKLWHLYICINEI